MIKSTMIIISLKQKKHSKIQYIFLFHLRDTDSAIKVSASKPLIIIFIIQKNIITLKYLVHLFHYTYAADVCRFYVTAAPEMMSI